MEALAGCAVHLHYVLPHHPAEKVDAVYALIHQRATVLLPRTAPGSLIVVALTAVPAHMDASVGKLPEPIGLDSVAEAAG